MSKIAFIDVDDILLDFQGFGVEYIRKHINPNLPPNYQPQTWSGEDMLPEGMGWKDVIKFMGSGWAGNLKAFPYAASFTKILHSNEIRIILITKMSQWHLDRMWNLNRCGIGYDEIYFCPYETPKNQYVNAILDRYPSDTKWCFLDDNADNCMDIINGVPLAKKNRIFTLDLPYNKHVKTLKPKPKNLEFCKTLNDAYDAVIEFFGITGGERICL